ncbi:MOSC domain-containing protein [Arthrobacter sp. ISL-48]|uniref:MOSC domain-containing protein n=1 Tax=Arthrobacter sp. ISL-48 TaxID=2819110 RepID=UPI001BE82684|nr:MOSC domain-containing protein [Arthrobacter sp. ISL-48]MBT2530946.1 MOSC domain-containing protein [Arthrobacter sp. ISL-48]
MQWASSVEDSGDTPVLVSPEGLRYRADSPGASQALTAAFGRELTLRRETTVQHYDQTPLHLVTTSSLAALESLSGAAVDERRFRANIVIDTGTEPMFHEEDWAGAVLAIGGEVVIRLGQGMPRCVMVDQPQTKVSAEPKTLKLLGAHNNTELGLQAHTVHTGTLRIGDAVTLRRAVPGKSSATGT